MKLAYFYITEQGEALAKKCNQVLQGDCYGKEDLKENLKKAMGQYDGIICIMATGIVVRMIADQVVHKMSDPAVVVMDQKGQFCISLLAGHLGGANELAKLLSQITGGQPVITTATDVEGRLSFDVFAKKNGLAIENIEELKYVSGALLEGKKVQVLCDHPEWKKKLEEEMKATNGRIREGKEDVGIQVVISHKKEEKKLQKNGHTLYLRPKIATIGIGCKKERGKEGADEALKDVIQQAGISLLSIKQIATIQRKAKEPVVVYLQENYKLPLKIEDEEEIKQLDLEALHIKQSSFVKDTVGVASVSTACAYLASNKGIILVDKQKFQGMTMSVAVEGRQEEQEMLSFLIEY